MVRPCSPAAPAAKLTSLVQHTRCRPGDPPCRDGVSNVHVCPTCRWERVAIRVTAHVPTGCLGRLRAGLSVYTSRLGRLEVRVGRVRVGWNRRTLHCATGLMRQRSELQGMVPEGLSGSSFLSSPPLRLFLPLLPPSPALLPAVEGLSGSPPS